jgi:hypothetical protein
MWCPVMLVSGISAPMTYTSSTVNAAFSDVTYPFAWLTRYASGISFATPGVTCGIIRGVIALTASAGCASNTLISTGS